jgi:hypothetical protein
MALPSSGPLSIADIRNEGVAGGCYSAGSPYSLGSLATAFGIPTDPDSISEFYGRSCPTTTTTTTTTSTTTTTTTAIYTVTIYGKTNAASPISGEAYLYTSNDGINYTPRGFINSSTCDIRQTFNVPSGTVLRLGVTDPIGDAISFNATTGTTCPLNEANFCYGDYSITINGNTNLAVNVFMTKAREYNYCGIPAPF